MATVEHESSPSVESAPDATTLCEAFQVTAARYADEIALRTGDGSVELTFADYAARVRRVAAGLAALGVHRGDTVGLMMTNRPEFQICDTGAFHLGATPFSLYNTSSPEQIAHIVSNADCRVVIAEEQFVERLRAVSTEGSGPLQIVTVDGDSGDLSLAELEQRGDPDFDFEAAWRAVEPGDVLTLIYTSGTTGPPKGVETTHANMLAECRAVGAVLPFRPGATITSYLPSAHIADRWSSHYNQIVFGIQITDVADMKQLPAVLSEVRPTIWGAVPRVLEKLKMALEAGIAAEPDEQRREATQNAIDAGLQKVRLEQGGEAIPDELAQAHAKAEELVLSKLRAKLGLDRVEWLIVGASPIARDVQEFMLALGLPLAEIWGMSELSCCATMAHPDDSKVGTVGPALPGVEVRLADDGELLVRGPTVMRGYRGEPEKTAETIDPDGWLHTGDIGEIDADGYIKIVDRKKELIINAGGKNMSPTNIEEPVKAASPLIGQAMCIGDNRPYNVALIVLDPDGAAMHAKRQGLSDASVESVAADPAVRGEVEAAVERANAQLSRVEQIKHFELLHEEWLPGGDELTPTMKLKRKPIAEKYAAKIEALYASG